MTVLLQMLDFFQDIFFGMLSNEDNSDPCLGRTSWLNTLSMAEEEHWKAANYIQ